MILDILLHLNFYLGQFLNAYGAWLYVLLFVVLFCETGLVITPFLPGDSLLFTAGALVATSTLNVHGLVLLLLCAVLCGDNCNYWIGRKLGRVLFQKNPRWLKRAYLERAHHFYVRYGGRAIIIARFLPIVRTFVPFTAGMGAMRYLVFIGFSMLGALLWVGVLTYLGYYFGNVPFVKQHFSVFIVVIIVVSLIPPVVAYCRRRF